MLFDKQYTSQVEIEKWRLKVFRFFKFTSRFPHLFVYRGLKNNVLQAHVINFMHCLHCFLHDSYSSKVQYTVFSTSHMHYFVQSARNLLMCYKRFLMQETTVPVFQRLIHALIFGATFLDVVLLLKNSS